VRRAAADFRCSCMKAHAQEFSMSRFLDPRWLLLLPLLSVITFTAWVLWNVTREIRIEKRIRNRKAVDECDQHVRKY
jgi:hypothetical protein